MNWDNFGAWTKAALIRAGKTFAQTAISVITVGQFTTIIEVDWVLVVSTAALAAALSVLTSVAGLPEVEESNENEDAE